MPDPESNETPDPEEAFGVRLIEETERPWEQFEGTNYYETAVGADAIAEDAKLTSAARKKLSASSFADPENKAYPIQDAGHARNAVVRFIQFGRRVYKGAKRSAVAQKILAACRRFGVKVTDMVRAKMMGDSVDADSLKVLQNLTLANLFAEHALWHTRNGMDSEGDGDLEHDAIVLEIQRRRTKT